MVENNLGLEVSEQRLQEGCLFAPYWYVDDLTDSVIEVKNNLTDVLTVRARLTTEGGVPIVLEEFELAPLGWSSVWLRSRLPAKLFASNGSSSPSWGDGSRPNSLVGSAYLEPVKPPGHRADAISGWIRVEDPTERLGVVATFETLTYAVSASEQHALWWLPFPNSRAYFALQNASTIPLELGVDLYTEVSSGSTEVSIPALGSTTLDIAGVLGHAVPSAMGGITFRAVRADPGDIGLNRLIGRGRVIQEQMGFATSLKLHESGVDAPSNRGGEVHAPVAFFGRLERLLPRSGMVLHPHLLLRNAGDRRSRVEIDVHARTGGGDPVKWGLAPLELGPQQMTDIDLEWWRRRSDTTLGEGVGGVRVRYDGLPTHLVAELVNVEEHGRFAWYDATRRRPLHQTTRQIVISLAIDDEHEPFLFLKNMTDQPQLPRIILDYAGGSEHYNVPISVVAPQQTVTVDIRRLRDDRVPDDKGELLPESLDFATAAVFHEAGAFAVSDPTFISVRPSTARSAAGPERDRDPDFAPSCARGGDREPPGGERPRIQTVKVWLNVFIPRDIPGLTIPRPNHPGETMAKPSLLGGANSLIPDCWATDQRTFSSFINASSRIHAEVVIEPDNPAAFIERVNAGVTHRIDCDSGNDLCVDFAHVERIHFTNARGSRSAGIAIDLEGAAHVPCFVPGVFFGDVDFNGTIFVHISSVDPSSAIVQFNGMIEPYPAYEMYAAANDGAGVPLFQVGLAPGAGPASLAGPANRPISGSATIQAR